MCVLNRIICSSIHCNIFSTNHLEHSTTDLTRPLTSLCSTDDISLTSHHLTSHKYRKRAFSYIVPSLRNSVLTSIISIRSGPSLTYINLI